MNEIERAVWQVVSDMNRAWSVEGNWKILKDYFHPNMVVITSTDRERIEGQDACISSWKAFMDMADVHYFREIDPHVQIYGENSCAAATYYFELSYDAGGETYDLSGRDMFVLAKENGKWWIVADQFSPYPKSA